MSYKDKEKIDNITTSTSTDYKCYYTYIGDPPPGTYPIITDPLPLPNTIPLIYGTCLCDSCMWKNTSACPRMQSNTSNTGTSSNKTITIPCETSKTTKDSKSCKQNDEGESPNTFRRIATALTSQYCRKNEAYGDSFGKSIRRYGIISALTRMSDKWNRLESLLVDKNKNNVNDESVDDTLLDLATYCIMTVLATRSKDEIEKIIEKLEGK